jgi:hypothetical protein
MLVPAMFPSGFPARAQPDSTYLRPPQMESSKKEKHMQALVYYGRNDVRYEDFPIPENESIRASA